MNVNTIFWSTYFFACAVFGLVCGTLGIPLKSVIVSIVIATPIVMICKNAAQACVEQLDEILQLIKERRKK